MGKTHAFISDYSNGTFDEDLEEACTNVTAGGLHGTIVIDRPSSPYTFTGPVTVPPEVTLIFQDGVIDMSAATGDLTINGPLIAPGKKIFDDDSSSHVKLRDETTSTACNKYIQYINPYWFSETSLSTGMTYAIAAGGTGAKLLLPDAATSLINIENYGCIPYTTDPTFDNGPPLNTLIARLGVDLFGALYVPGRAYGVATMIDVPKTLQAFNMQGNGGWIYVNEASGYMGCASRFLWTGINGGTMFQTSSHGTSIDGIAFVGYAVASGDTHTLSAINNAGIGIQTIYDSGINNSMMHLGHVSVAKCDIGVQFGVSNVSDQSRIDMLNLYNCTVGVYNSAGQQVGNSIGKIFAMHTPTVIDFRGGGLVVDSCEFTSTFTKLAYVYLSNTVGTLTLNNIRIDANQQDKTIIDAWDNTTTGRVQINMNNFRGATAPANPVIHLAGLSCLNMNNAMYLTEDLIKCKGSTGRRVRVAVRDSVMGGSGLSPANLVDEADSTGPWTLEWSGCYDNYGATIAADGTTGEDT